MTDYKQNLVNAAMNLNGTLNRDYLSTLEPAKLVALITTLARGLLLPPRPRFDHLKPRGVV